MARVVIREGGTERTVELVDPITVAGRALENKIVLQDRQSSRRHCQFERIEWGYKLVDLESRNGTRVNDRTVNQSLLRPGDCVQVGQALLIFEDLNFREPPPEVVARFGPPMPVLSAAAPTPLATPLPPPLPPPPAPLQPPPPAAPAAYPPSPAVAPRPYAAPPPAAVPPVPVGIPAAAPEPVLRRRGTPTTSVDRGFRAAMVERAREQKIVTCVGVCAALFGLLIAILIVFSLFSGESPALKTARENVEKARELRIKDPGQALRLLKGITPDLQPYYGNAQGLIRQIEADLARQRAAVGEAEQKDFNELYEFCERNRNTASAYEQMYSRCVEYRRKYPRSPLLPKLEEYQKIAQEGRVGSMRSEIAALEQQVAEDLQKSDYADALRRVNALLEKYKAEIEARAPIVKVHDEVVDKARGFWEAQDAKARELKERGQKDEARRAYEEANVKLGEGKLEELKDFCTLAQACLEALK